jgi:hypothetical protein
MSPIRCPDYPSECLDCDTLCRYWDRHTDSCRWYGELIPVEDILTNREMRRHRRPEPIMVRHIIIHDHVTIQPGAKPRKTKELKAIEG